ncbi:MAG: nucleotidyltransferase domain-containing protein [Sporichthyaceae bacterium]|nr:nucleotidyltransferase domain-containing protein [Sporichthyaceae bacterium]
MSTPGSADTIEAVSDTLRSRGAIFAFVCGSRARGDHRRDSDLDVAAWWRSDPPQSFDVLLPAGVDLLVLNGAPLELAGRVALEGTLLFDDDPPQRVRWLATTRKIYADELPRIQRNHREFAESLRHGR